VDGFTVPIATGASSSSLTTSCGDAGAAAAAFFAKRDLDGVAAAADDDDDDDVVATSLPSTGIAFANLRMFLFNNTADVDCCSRARNNTSSVPRYRWEKIIKGEKKVRWGDKS
jgi:hypothetical protein